MIVSATPPSLPSSGAPSPSSTGASISMNGNNIHHSQRSSSPVMGSVCVNNGMGNTCIMAKVKAQVMTRDDSTGGWLPISGGGLSHVMLIRRNSASSSLSTSTNNVISSPAPPASNSPVNLQLINNPTSTSPVQNQSAGTSNNNNQGLLTPNVGQNCHFTNVNTDNSNYEYIIVGTRISDKNVVLYCSIKSDFIYHKVMPTFHHWMTGSVKFGLTFTSPGEAKNFESAIKQATNDLLISGKIDDHEDPEDIFMRIDLPVHAVDSNGLPIIRKGSNGSGHRTTKSSQSNHHPNRPSNHGSSRSSSNSPVTTSSSSKSGILNQVVPPPGQQPLMNHRGSSSRSNHGSRTSTNSSTSSTSSASSANSSERNFHHHKVFPNNSSNSSLRRVPPVPILVTSPSISSAPRADMVDYREAAAAEELAKRSISNGSPSRDLKLDCCGAQLSMDKIEILSSEKFQLKELSFSSSSAHEYSYPTVALGQHSPSSTKLLTNHNTSSNHSPSSNCSRKSELKQQQQVESIDDLKPVSDNKINESLTEDLKFSKKYPGLHHLQLPSKRRKEQSRLGSFFSSCFGSSKNDSKLEFSDGIVNICGQPRSGTVSSSLNSTSSANETSQRRLFARSTSTTSTGFKGGNPQFKKSISTTGTTGFIGHMNQAPQYVQCKHCMEYYSPNGPPLGSLSTVNSISRLSSQIGGNSTKIFDPHAFKESHNKQRKVTVDECESAPDAFLNCISCLTCICAANTVLYHCVDKDEDDVGPSGTDLDDSLCCGGSSCYPPSPNHPHYKDQQRRCRKRWLFLSVLSFFIPCLMCYPCLKGCHRSAKNRSCLFSSPICCCCLPSCVGGRHEPIDHNSGR